MLVVVISIVVMWILFKGLMYLMGVPLLSCVISLACGCELYRRISKFISNKITHDIEKAMDKIHRRNFPHAIEKFNQIKQRYKYLRLFLSRTIDGQIGIVYYMSLNYKKAPLYLERAMQTDWMAKTMLAVIAYKRKDYEKMDKIFSRLVRYMPRQSFLWSVWAYCHWRIGNIDRAISILNKGRDAFGAFRGYFGGYDKNIVENLTCIRGGKKMKMGNYGQNWQLLNLEPAEVVRFPPGKSRFTIQGFK